MPTYRINAGFVVNMSIEVEAESPEEAAAAWPASTAPALRRG